MNILSSKAHNPAGVFSSSLSNISEGKTFMKEIKECPSSAGAALFPYDRRSNGCVWDPGSSPARREKRAVRFTVFMVGEHLGMTDLGRPKGTGMSF